MLCVKCKKEIPDGSAFCNYCGRSQERHARKRANGEGSVYKQYKLSTWCAVITTGYSLVDGKAKANRIYKYGFKTKREAMEWIASAKTNRIVSTPTTLSELYTDWTAWYGQRVGREIGESTMAGYRAAYKYLSGLNARRVDQITAADLQDCIDKCPNGKRTKQNMRTLSGLLFKRAIDLGMIVRNPAQNLYVGNDPTIQREPLTDEDVRTVEDSGLEYSEYIVSMCYLGFRPTEFFKLKKLDLHRDGEIAYLIGGSKTEAGIDRAVTIPPHIMPIVENRMSVDGTDLLFPRMMRNRKGEFTGFAEMGEAYFRESIFKPMMAKLGIVGKLPYGTRHTYSNKLGDAQGADRTKADLMGHADYTTTKTRYQSSDLERKAKITDQMQ